MTEGLNQQIHILDAQYIRKLTNTQLIEKACKFFDLDKVITCDSSEPARIQEFRNHGLKVRAVKKKPNSIKAGIDYLKRFKIIVKPNQIEFINELQTYSYKWDKVSDELIDEPLDFNNHGIDAIRYSLEDYIYRLHVKAFDAGGI